MSHSQDFTLNMAKALNYSGSDETLIKWNCRLDLKKKPKLISKYIYINFIR